MQCYTKRGIHFYIFKERNRNHSFLFFVLLNLASQVNNNDSVVTIQHLQGNE